MKIPCEQFIYGKYLGAARSASYSVLARSPQITDEIVKEIRANFNGCRPVSVNLSSYDTSYAISPIGDSIVFLRLDAVQDSASGNKVILYERYLIISQREIEKIAAWLFLRKIPEPELLYSGKSLEDFIRIDDGGLYLRQVRNLFLSLKDRNAETIFPIIYQLLNSLRLVVTMRHEHFSLDWLYILSLMLPPFFEMSLRVFIGNLKNISWAYDLAITYAPAQIEKDSNAVLVFDIDNGAGLSIDSGYTDFLWRCMSSKNHDLLVQTISWVYSVHASTFVDVNKTITLDFSLKRAIPSPIKLELARDEYSRNIFGKDVYELWSEGILSARDIEVFLPGLLSGTLDQWSQKDFILLARYTEKLSSRKVADIILQGDVSTQSQFSLLMKWGSKVSNLSNSEVEVWIYLLIHLSSKDPKRAFDVLTVLLQQIDLSRFNDVKQVLLSFSVKPDIPPQSFWKMVFWAFHFIKHASDLTICIDLFSAATFFEESQSVLSFLKYLSGKDYARNNGPTVIENFLRNADHSKVFSTVLSHVVNIVLLSNYPDALVALVLSLSKFNMPTVFINRVRKDNFSPDMEVLFVYKKHVLESENEKYISSYITLLSVLLYKEDAQQTFTHVLVDDVSLFEKVVNFSRSVFGAHLNSFRPSLLVLRNLESEEQLRVWIAYFVILELDDLSDKLASVDRLLKNFNSLAFLDSNILEKFLSLLLEHQEWSTARMILEHQTRSAILDRSRDIDPKLNKLLYVVHHGRKINLSENTKRNMVISYFRNLSDSDKKEFATWLLIKPLSSSPILKQAKRQPLTSEVIFDHTDWFTDDPFIRYCLLKELSLWKGLV